MTQRTNSFHQKSPRSGTTVQQGFIPTHQPAYFMQAPFQAYQYNDITAINNVSEIPAGAIPVSSYVFAQYPQYYDVIHPYQVNQTSESKRENPSTFSQVKQQAETPNSAQIVYPNPQYVRSRPRPREVPQTKHQHQVQFFQFLEQLGRLRDNEFERENESCEGIKTFGLHRRGEIPGIRLQVKMLYPTKIEHENSDALPPATSV